MPSDPRLADMTVLILAAKRLAARQQVPDWRSAEGMHALLEAARYLPRRGPWDLPDLDDRSGLSGLLHQARQWQKGGCDGT